MDSDLLYQYNPWWEGAYTVTHLFTRAELEASMQSLMATPAVIFLTGLRRVGKTTLMKKTIAKLLQDKVNPHHILYISMDDYQLKDENFADIITMYRKTLKLKSDTKLYLFFDEVAYVKDFRQQLKNLYDKEVGKIVVTSSSSSGLKDTRGWLTGRERQLEVLPLNFDEYLIFRNLKVKQRDAALKESYFEEYMQDGGMPEYVLTKDREYLTNLINDIIYKDIIAYHNIRQGQLIKDFFHLLMERAGKQISLNKIANILNISADSAKRYLNMFEETYLIYLVPRFAKTNENILAPKKIYAADIGIRHMMTGFRDKSAIFENIVFSLIKHKHPAYVYQDGYEIDFITEDKHLLEVKYGKELNEKQRALFDKFPANKKTVIRGMSDLHLLTETN